MTIKDKLQFVFLPYLLICGGFISGWLLLQKILIIESNLLPIKEFTTQFFISVVIIVILIHLFLRPRLKVFDEKTSEILYGLSVIVIWLSSMLMSSHYSKSAYDLIPIDSITALEQFPNEKYFQITDYQLDRNDIRSHIRTTITGRNQKEFTAELYFASPFQASKNVWNGIKYNESISKNRTDEAKKIFLQSFYKQQEKLYKHTILEVPTYFERVFYSDDSDGFEIAINKIKPSKTEKTVVLIPKYNRFEERLTENENIYFRFYIIGIGSLIFLIIVLFKRGNKSHYHTWKKAQLKRVNFLNNKNHYLNPFGNHSWFATIFFLSVGVFLYQVLFLGTNIMYPSSNEVIAIGGLQQSDLATGEYWRWFTHLFTYLGVAHLISDLFLIAYIYIMSFSKESDNFLRLITFFTTALLGAFVTISIQEEAIIGFLFGNIGIFGFFMIEKYKAKEFGIIYLIIPVLFIGIILFRIPYLLKGSVASFFVGILFHLIFKRSTKSKSSTYY